MKSKQILFPILLVFLLFTSCQSNKRPPYLDPSLDFETRAKDLVSRMTLEEKVSQMVYNAPAIERLSIPQYNWWGECLHGVARAGKATVFPQAIALAAMFDTAQMHLLADIISDEARAKYYEFQKRGKRGIYQGLTFWSPNINIFRDPRWGRGQETYGEDPYLTGQMGVSFIKGLQGDDQRYLKLVATAKHYLVHSGPEPIRHQFNAVISERDFRDTYLPAFRSAVVDAGVYSVMCAYNRYMGKPCCGSDEILTQILRHELGFKGYIVSDCWAVMDFYTGHKVAGTMEEAAALAVRSGTDLNCGISFPSLPKAVEQGLITEEEITTSVERLMLARMKLGMFDSPERVPWSNIPYESVNSRKHERIAYETTLKSLVLLKNEKNTLPLSKDLKTLAVIGPNADDVEVLLGNYNGTPYDPVTPLQGIRQKIGKKTKVLYALGCEWAENMPVVEMIPKEALFTNEAKDTSGLHAAFYPNLDFTGKPVAKAINDTVNFNWWDTTPYGSLPDDTFGVRWTGFLVPPVTGIYVLGAEARDFKLFIGDSLVARFHSDHAAMKQYSEMYLEAGKAYPIRLDFTDFHGDASIRLFWRVPGRDLEKEAMAAARKADAVVMFMGLSPRLEGEEMSVDVEGFKGGDRTSLDLPKVQENLIRKVHALGKPIVLVLLNGSALSINWENENIPAILEAWYPGQAAGTAIADVLFGDYNPAGRLPVTFYKSIKQLPPFESYDMKGRTYRYMTEAPLYPFGYGLSYTTFAYSNLQLEKDTILPGEKVHAYVDVTNTGKIAGDEVVQLYIRDMESSVVRPKYELQGFHRVNIQPGQTVTVEFLLQDRNLEFYSEKDKKYIVEPGEFLIMVGPSSREKDLVTTVLHVK
jgi:beta-glucosidase